MKQSYVQKLIIACSIVLGVGGLLWWLSKRPYYDWDYRPKEQATTAPFSTLLFDSLMQESLPMGYTKSHHLDSMVMLNLQGKRKDNFIVQYFDETHSQNLTPKQLKALFQLAKKGSQIVIPMRSNEQLYFSLFSLYTETPYNYQGLRYVTSPWWKRLKQIDKKDRSITLNLYTPFHVEQATLLMPLAARTLGMYNTKFVQNDNGQYQYDWEEEILSSELREVSELLEGNDLLTKVVAHHRSWSVDADGDTVLGQSTTYPYCVSFSFASGGAVSFTTLDVAFTNYACVNPEWKKVQKYFVAPLSNRHLVRIENNKKYDPINDYQEGAYSSRRDLQYFLENPPLRFALYLFLLMGILLLLFNTRRRHAVLTPQLRLHNSSLNYIEQIGALFTTMTDYRALLLLEQQFLLKSLQQHFQTNSSLTKPCHYLPLLAQRLQWSEKELQRQEYHQSQIEELLLDLGDSVPRNAYITASKSIHALVELLQQ